MQVLEQNEIDKLIGLGCDPTLDLASVCRPYKMTCGNQYYCSLLDCRIQYLCHNLGCKALDYGCGSIAKCDGPLVQRLTDGLTACGDGFLHKCSNFGEIEQDWPELDAKLKEQMLLDRISKLEAKVERLDPKK